MTDAAALPDASAIDPRPCEHCGLTIDRHQMVDDGEGPEFFCLALDDMTLPELERRAELIRLIETAEIFARLEAMDDPSTRPPAPRAEPRPYRTPQATVEAFFFVVAMQDPQRLQAWLADHPRDAAFLMKRLQEKLEGLAHAAA
jgi:hypothetical protein